MSVFTLVQGDVLPRLRAVLTTATGVVIDLTEAVGVTFIMRDRTTAAPFIERPAEIVDPLLGRVAFTFTELDSAVAGEYQGQFVVEFMNGAQTYPTEGFIDVLIRPRLDADEIESYVTPRDVYTRTLTDVTVRDIASAMAIIGDLIGVDLILDTTLEVPDDGRLKAAVCYQAAWMKQQPDLFARLDVTTMSLPGFSFNLVDSDAVFLAPMAARMLRRLSWVKEECGTGKGTLIPVPFMSRFANRSGIYTDEMAFGMQPIVRPPLSEEYFWRTGPAGPIGLTGIAGPQGVPGPASVPGTYMGATPPDEEALASAAAGSGYIDTSSFTLYRKD